jgi:hypothetical protein
MLPACGGKSDPPLAVLTVSEGNVLVTKTGSASPVAGSAGMDLKPGDTIITGAAAKAAVTFFEGSVIELKPDTQVEISSLITAGESSSTTISLKQQVGKTISTVKKLADPKSRYDVITPAAVAGVRGSTMYVSVAQGGRTIVGNIEGLISATAQGVEVQVPVNSHVTVVPGNPPEQPQPGATPDLQSADPAGSTPGRTVSNNLFEGSGVAFNYPGTWQTVDKTQYNDPSMIAYFKEPGAGAYIQVSEHDMFDNVSADDLKTYHDAWMSGFIVGQPISSKTLTAAGMPAYDTVFNDDVSRWRLVSLAKGSKVYDLSLSANTDSFDQASKEFDILVNSLVVQ